MVRLWRVIRRRGSWIIERLRGIMICRFIIVVCRRWFFLDKWKFSSCIGWTCPAALGQSHNYLNKTPDDQSSD